MVNKMAAIQYCLEVTSRKMEYWLLFQNCQKFAKEIIICMTGDKKILKKSPIDAESFVAGFATVVTPIAGVLYAINSLGASANQGDDSID